MQAERVSLIHDVIQGLHARTEELSNGPLQEWLRESAESTRTILRGGSAQVESPAQDRAETPLPDVATALTFVFFQLNDVVAGIITARTAGALDALQDRYKSSIAEIAELQGLPRARELSNALFDIISDVVDTTFRLIQESSRRSAMWRKSAAEARDIASVELLAEVVAQLRKVVESNDTLTTSVNPSEYLILLRRAVWATNQQIELPDLFVTRRADLDALYVPPTLVTIASGERLKTDQFPWTVGRTVVLGNPGAGKTTLARFISARYSLQLSRPIPITVTLRRFEDQLSNGASVFELLSAEMARLAGRPSEALLNYLLGRQAILVILDGIDEIAENETRQRLVESVNGFIAQHTGTPMLLSCRIQGFDSSVAPSDSTITVLQDLSEPEVEEYALRWFRESGDEELVDDFMNESAEVSDVRANPLMLALLCLLYERSRTIPDQRADLYQRCAALLFREWDKYRRVKIGSEFDEILSSALDELAFVLYFGSSATFLIGHRHPRKPLPIGRQRAVAQKDHPRSVRHTLAVRYREQG